MNVVVVTVSDSRAAGDAEDTGGPLVCALVEAEGWRVARRALVPDDHDGIAAALREACADVAVDLVVTTGGTGLAPRDVTPEATRAVIEREVPGIPERMRAVGMAATPFAALSRQVCGVRDATLILNLPGSERAIREGFAAVAEVLPHAVQIMQGRGV